MNWMTITIAGHPRRLEDFDIEQNDAEQHQEIAGADRHAPPRQQWNAEQRRAEVHVQQERDHVVEHEWDQQEREGNQVHDGVLLRVGSAQRNQSVAMNASRDQTDTTPRSWP
jgi:hypothetical protein